MKTVVEFQIINSLEGLQALRDHLEEVAESWNLSKKQLFEINLIIEEVCTNNMHHAGSDVIPFTGVKLCLKDGIIFITITDNGPKFDPTKIPPPDVHLPVDQRQAGGLGLYLTKHYADSLSYERTQNTNTLSIEKKWDNQMVKNMDITVSQNNDVIIVAVTGRLDTAGSRELESWVALTFSPPSDNVTMDFSHLDYISSAGLRVMLNMSKLMKKNSLEFSICSAPDHVREVLEISGFDSFIPLYRSVDEYMKLRVHSTTTS